MAAGARYRGNFLNASGLKNLAPWYGAGADLGTAWPKFGIGRSADYGLSGVRLSGVGHGVVDGNEIFAEVGLGCEPINGLSSNCARCPLPSSKRSSLAFTAKSDKGQIRTSS